MQRVKPAPRNAEHADLAGAPFLGSKPSDHFERVVLFLVGVFIKHQTFGITIAAHVDAHARITVAREIGMGQGIAHMGAITLAVGQIFKQGRNFILCRVNGNEHAGRKPHTVGHRDPEIFNFFGGARKFGDGFEGHGFLMPQNA